MEYVGLYVRYYFVFEQSSFNVKGLIKLKCEMRHRLYRLLYGRLEVAGRAVYRFSNSVLGLCMGSPCRSYFMLSRMFQASLSSFSVSFKLTFSNFSAPQDFCF